MFVFIAEILPEQIAAYMSSVLVPEYLQNLQLEPVRFSPEKLNCNGTQPLLLHYSAHGRLEDFELRPTEHSLPLLKEVLPELLENGIRPIPDAVLWTWNTDVMTVYFGSMREELGLVGKACDANDGYVSVTRKTLFLSFALFRRYFVEQYHQIGLEMPEEMTTCWDSGVGGVVASGRPVSAQCLLSDATAIRDILRFSQLDKTLEHVVPWVRVPWDDLPGMEMKVTSDGVHLSLVPVGEE